MTKPAQIRLGKLAVADLSEIVTVHIRSFPRSATTRLGPEVVRRYYEWLFLGPHQAHYLGAWVNSQLGGFCVCGQFRGAMAGFLVRNKWFLVRQVLIQPWVLGESATRTAVKTGICAFLRRPSEHQPAKTKIQDIRKFAILAIAVAPEWRRAGLGAAMMKMAEAVAQREGFAIIGLTVRPENSSALRFYAALGWNVREDGQPSQKLLQKHLPPLVDSSEAGVGSR